MKSDYVHRLCLYHGIKNNGIKEIVEKWNPQDFEYQSGPIAFIINQTKRNFGRCLLKAKVSFGGLRKVWWSGVILLSTKIKIFNDCFKCYHTVLKLGLSQAQWYVNCKHLSTDVWGEFLEFGGQELLAMNGFGIFHSNSLSKRSSYLKGNMNSYLLHTLHKPITEIVHTMLEWNPQCGRKPGRRRKTWKTTVDKESNKSP